MASPRAPPPLQFHDREAEAGNPEPADKTWLQRASTTDAGCSGTRHFAQPYFPQTKIDQITKVEPELKKDASENDPSKEGYKQERLCIRS
ncbi:hypothetical protein NDU88_006181 [Pleurodeles waltl]|uniref:Uncharacterized protein n=1 Tax=Pleurodeles waltl TaxID=8319 RepID=A0AAV7QKG3_PLEWA|nr:hypothetical protein NDU88_006181 [Pleurodeles waltl]